MVGIAFVAALATSLGIISGTPKTFMVVYLTFLYIVTNDNGVSAVLDFAGFYGTPTAVVTATYAAIAAALLGLAQVSHVRRGG